MSYSTLPVTRFWFNAARQFHEVHLTGGKDYVQKNLGTEGNMSLGNTFQLLLNLVVFFDRHREQQWEVRRTLTSRRLED